MNEQLETTCDRDLTRQLRGKSLPKNELLAEEQRLFLPLPSQTFEAHRVVQAHADSLSLVRFDRNSYSVPTKYAHRLVTVVGTVDEVRLIYEDTLIARHERDWNVDHLAFLLQLCELELIDRERRASERRLKTAKFPMHKTLETFGFKAQPSLNKVLVTELMLGEYIDKRENILLVGNSGPGSPTSLSHRESQPVAEADEFASIESRN